MTNQERIQARIARDKQRREAIKLVRAEQYGRIEKVITNQHLLHSLMRRMRGTHWKQSVQEYVSHAIVRNKRQKDAILVGEHPEPSKILLISICERGKLRCAHAVAIDSRVVQGTICDWCIAPLTHPGLIHDNPASMAGKGISWARKRIAKHIRKQFQKTGHDTYVMVFDLKGFFTSIRHELCRRIFQRVHMDESLISLTMHFIKMFQVFDARRIPQETERQAALDRLNRNEEVGVSLGSQISQEVALSAPNRLDHEIKDVCSTNGYMRYMDDGNAMGTKDAMKRLMEKAMRTCRELGFLMHESKTQIVKLSRGFQYLKIHYLVTDTGRVIKKMAKAGIVRMRRKLKRLRELVNLGKVTLDDVFFSVQSWMGNVKKYCNAYRSRKNILNLYHKLFHSYRMEGVIA